jgi:hypothetical protein
MRHTRSLIVTLFVGLLALGASHSLAAGTPENTPGTPENTVKRYWDAVKAGKFEDAYKCISKGMAKDQDSEVWSMEMRKLTATCELKVFKYQVFPAQQQGDATTKVPNILSSQDSCANKLAVDEYELYTLVKENGEWKIDQQAQVDKAEQAKWFKKP